MEQLGNVKEGVLLAEAVHKSSTKERVISAIVKLLEKASYEDLKLFLIFIERYLRKKK